MSEKCRSGFPDTVDYEDAGPIKTRWVIGGRRVGDVMRDPPEAVDEVHAKADREDVRNMLQVLKKSLLAAGVAPVSNGRVRVRSVFKTAHLRIEGVRHRIEPGWMDVSPF